MNPTPSHEEYRLLVVDDEPLVLEMVKRALKTQPFAVTVACDIDSALAALQESKYHVVLTDLVMPQVNGPEIISRLRETQPHLAAIYMSGYGPESLKKYGLEGEVFLSKPFSVESLVAVVERAMEGT